MKNVYTIMLQFVNKLKEKAFPPYISGRLSLWRCCSGQYAEKVIYTEEQYNSFAGKSAKNLKFYVSFDVMDGN